MKELVMEDSKRIWINKDEWDLNIAWRKWRDATIKIPQEQAKGHPLYKEVQSIIDRIENKKINNINE